MADRRKLQGEIERCLKKVSEGVETFEDTWQKVYSATNTNQKEKYEADLKKEIKKLQRLRDQIKTWLTSSDIKDKRSLQDARKVIETQMERFKVVERETKTKAYSKEGLGAAQKMDPAQKEREEITSWLTACIECLSIQVDKFESEIDTINFSLKKKKNDKEKLDRLDELKIRHGKHKYHINQLEALLRMLDNGTVEVDQIKKIKDDVEYYRDCSEDPDFQENEFIYDDLNLEDLEDYLAKQQAAYQSTPLDLKSTAEEEGSAALSNTPTSTSTNSPSHSPSLGNHSSETSTPLPKAAANVPESSPSRNTEKSPSPVETCTSSESNSSATSLSNFHNCQSVINSQQSSTSYASATPATPSNHYKMSNNHESTWSSANSTDEELSNTVNTKPPFHSMQSATSEAPSITTSHISKPTPVNNSWTDSNFTFVGSESSATVTASDANDQQQTVFKSSSDSQSDVNKNVSAVNGPDSVRSSFISSVPLSVSSNSVMFDDTQSTLKNLAERAVLSSGINNHIHNLHLAALQNKGSQLTHNVLRNNTNDLFSDSNLPSSLNHSPATGTAEINISHIFGEVPQNQSPENAKYLEILEAAYKHLPLPMDSQRDRHLGIGCPTPTPDYYNTHISNSNSMEFFQRLSTETLFFIFYFLQGTKAQYFAARALKTKSWRFHTMFMMWFQRHEEPKTITDEYEQGTYIYFDYEKWAQRKKEGFTFEYKYLEDRDLN